MSTFKIIFKFHTFIVYEYRQYYLHDNISSIKHFTIILLFTTNNETYHESEEHKISLYLRMPD